MLLMSNLAVMQWLVGPVLYFSDFNPGQVLEITIMQVSEDEYFRYAFPATLLFVIGLNSNTFNRNFDLRILLKSINSSKLRRMVIVGVIAGMVQPFLPGSLKFVFTVLVYLSYGGLAGLVLMKHKSYQDKVWIFLSLLFIVLGSISSAMFGELVFFLMLLSLMYFYFYQTSVLRKFVLGSWLVLLVVFIQIIKMPLRELSRRNEDTGITNLQKVIKSDAVSLRNLNSEQFRAYTVARFNNGAVISFVLNRVPNKIDYAHGNTILSAVVGSFIPRLFWPSKEGSGTAMYLKYTGLRFEGASYGISQLGEGYANFGKNGGIFYMFVLGVSISFFLNKILKFSMKHPSYILFLPILFLHGIKVETELNRSFGFMLRVIVVLFLLNFGLKILSNNKFSLY